MFYFLKATNLFLKPLTCQFLTSPAGFSFLSDLLSSPKHPSPPRKMFRATLVLLFVVLLSHGSRCAARRGERDPADALTPQRKRPAHPDLERWRRAPDDLDRSFERLYSRQDAVRGFLTHLSGILAHRPLTDDRSITAGRRRPFLGVWRPFVLGNCRDCSRSAQLGSG